MKIVKIKLEVANGTTMPIASINYDPEKLIKETLVWKSVTPKYIEINDETGDICAIQCGCGTVCAEDKNGVIRVYCIINVKNADEKTVATTSVATKAITSSNEPISYTYSNWYGYDNTDTVESVGYSGKSFSYSKTGTYVTLESGWSTKSGTQNTDSSLFRAELVTMNDYFASLTYEQRQAWLKLRVEGFFTQISIFDPSSLSKTALNMAKEILMNAGIDLGSEFEATINGFYDWYASELAAESYFRDF